MCLRVAAKPVPELGVISIQKPADCHGTKTDHNILWSNEEPTTVFLRSTIQLVATDREPVPRILTQELYAQ